MDTQETNQEPQAGQTTEQRNEHERNEEKVLLEWDAPARPFKKRDREYYTTIAVIVFLVSLILFFAGQFLFIAVVISLAFVSYVLASVAPDHIHNRVSTFGIHVGDQLFYWEELGRFWFTTKYGHDLMHVETARAFPGVLIVLLDGVEKENMKKIMLKYTVHEKPRPTWLDKAANWMQAKFPLDKDEPPQN
ncbi:MAG TPA: hypothetical protein VLH19_01275 [Patescibacteria group bacterium]|nr:hypothetical protein [Patescibacteria group bacterium]